jgi:DNA-binding IclR family transcriptional regulator
MAAGLRGAGDLAALAQPSLLRLAAAAGDTALLSVRSGPEAVHIAREVGEFPLQPNKLQVGSRRPLGVGAGSLALLAALADSEVDTLLEILAPRIAALPRLPETLIREKIVEARQQGYTLLLDTTYEGLGGIGVPVHGALGELVCALSIAALTPRIREREQMLADQLRREAQLLSRTLSSRNAGEAQARKAAGGRR